MPCTNAVELVPPSLYTDNADRSSAIRYRASCRSHEAEIIIPEVEGSTDSRQSYAALTGVLYMLV